MPRSPENINTQRPEKEPEEEKAELHEKKAEIFENALGEKFPKKPGRKSKNQEFFEDLFKRAASLEKKKAEEIKNKKSEKKEKE